MRWTRFFTTLLTYVVLTTSLHANCTSDQDKHSSKPASLLITDFTISGTQTIDSAELAEGRQYRMGRLEIFARKEMADRLRAE